MSHSDWIPYGKQSVSEQDIEAVCKVLRSDWLTQGPMIEKFEKAITEYCGAKYAVAVCNATAALHIAYLASNLNKGDWLWTSPNTFVASANCALYCGAKVDFVDIDPQTYNLSVSELDRKLVKAKKNGVLPKVVVPVHFAGQSCEMETIRELSQIYGFQLVEDASHAIGGSYQGKSVGSCQYSEMTVFSFHPVKIITTGEGGLVLTNSEDLYHKLIRLRTHGITNDPRFMEGEPNGPWDYQQVDLSLNFRLTDIHAALGYSQLQRIDSFIKRRHQLVEYYNEKLSELPITLPRKISNTYSAYHLYVIRLQLEKITKSYRQVFEELRAAGLGVNLHYIPVHTQPYFRRLGFKKGDFPNAEKYSGEAISIPLFFELPQNDQDYVISTLKRIIK